MRIRSLLFSAIFLCGSSSIATAQSTTPTPCGFAYGNVCGGFSTHIHGPGPAVSAPRYVGPMGTNPNPSAFAAPQANKNALSVTQPNTNIMAAATGKTIILMGRPSRKSTCYTIHSYTITPESDTVGITQPTSESTCIAADNFSMKQAAQPPNGPDFR
jgi:hypothetical protein